MLLHVDGESKHSVPFGKWLEEDLLLAAFRLSSGVHRKSAKLLGIAETTARRRIGYLVERASLEPQSRHPDWMEIPNFLEQWILSEKSESQDLIVLARHLLLECVMRQVGEKSALASSLMGVTEPTYLRWREKLEQSACVNAQGV